MSGLRHLVWIPIGALVGFGAAFVFDDLLALPSGLYHTVYFVVVLGFLTFYVWWTGLEVTAWMSRRVAWGIGLGLVGGVVLMQGVFAQPATGGLGGPALAWDVFWRGLVYGSVDGLLLFAFPWVVVWRALGAETGGWPRRVGAGVVAWLAVLIVTTAYHLGYADFRSEKILQPNIGSAIGAVPTLVSANPVASPVSHVIMHVTAVLHAPETDLFLPPHRSR